MAERSHKPGDTNRRAKAIVDAATAEPYEEYEEGGTLPPLVFGSERTRIRASEQIQVAVNTNS